VVAYFTELIGNPMGKTSVMLQNGTSFVVQEDLDTIMAMVPTM
jgi:uncharacterized protein YlzI (FlbEa/FlbD family)